MQRKDLTPFPFPRYQMRDQVGSLRALVDASGAVVKAVEYDAFGNVVSDTNPGLEAYVGFAGGLQDRDTGLVRFGYRDYLPDIGRWTARDPIAIAGGDWDLHTYVRNDPVNRLDQDGLTARTNIQFIWDFLFGGGETYRQYSISSDIELQEMMTSQGAEALRTKFRESNCNETTLEYTTWEAAKDTVFWPTRWGSAAFQVGGFIGTAKRSPLGTVTYVIDNYAGTYSFFYHIPFVNNRVDSTGPFRTIHQRFMWRERIRAGDSAVPN